MIGYWGSMVRVVASTARVRGFEGTPVIRTSAISIVGSVKVSHGRLFLLLVRGVGATPPIRVVVVVGHLTH